MKQSVEEKSFAAIKDPPGASRLTMPALFEGSLSRHGQRPIILFDDESSLSYSNAGVLARDIAGCLQGMGVRKGDRVVSVAGASAESALVFWAAALTGAVFVPIDRNAAPKAISSILEKTDPKAVFIDPDCPGIKALNGLQAISYCSGNEATGGLKPFSEWLEEGQRDFHAVSVLPGDDAIVLFTSGTTGEPKGVVLSHGALCGSGRLMAEAYGWSASDRVFSTGDFHTMSGLRNPCVAALYAGASFIIVPQGSRASAVASSELLEKLGATVLCTVPAFIKQFTQFHERVSKGFTRTLRLVMSTGTILPEGTAGDFERIYGKEALDYYGLTETSGLCIGVLPGMAKKYRGTVGIPLGCEVRVTDPNSGQAVENGEGVLEIRTDNLMTGYYADPDATGKVLNAGWYRSADLCRRRPDGAIEILGRVDDAFKVRMGDLVHPLEIERALEESPLVAEAAVCGFNTGDGVPAAAAFIVPKERAGDEKRLASELRRHSFSLLGAGRTPVLFRFVDSLPRGTNGKILRRKLQESLR